ncbi:MAG: molybdopterin-guanine dinucleotide biosynthesis protein MobA [Pseudonocardiaceae bacterium]|nr:molybdopterin-guanine dinucleotide biosynthesis protein MobA [Pseudonocardiaceae bacterium]
MSHADAVNTLEAWTARACQALDLDPEMLDRDLVLDMTRDVAHGVARPAAPLTAFLVGLAAGRDGGDAEAVRAACDTVQQLTEQWTVR